ncbi:hypothetical protein FXO38_06186 [Capsicum annuum]|nr:hypothetical protein FXO38_06186 [Capsicum annuum]
MSDEYSQSLHSVDIHMDPVLKLEGSPQLSRCQARHRRYMQFRCARKKKTPNKELLTDKGDKSSKKIDLGKHKCFIFYDKGCLAKECPKFKKVKREVHFSMNSMDCHEDLDDPYPVAEEILRSAFNIEKKISEDIFIASNHYLSLVNSYLVLPVTSMLINISKSMRMLYSNQSNCLRRNVHLC